MKIALIINPKEYIYHNDLSRKIMTSLSSQNHTVSIVDINANAYDHNTLSQIKQFDPDVMITLDLAGFRFRSQSGECALNLLYSKNLNIIWGDKPEYALWLTGKLSLSMLFYDVSGKDNKLQKKYPNLLYYKWENENFPDNWDEIWNDFLKEIN